MKIGKTIRKFSILALCFFMLAAGNIFNVSAKEDFETPVIVVTGYGTPSLFVNFGEDGQKQIWQFSVMSVLQYIAEHPGEVAGAFSDFFAGDGSTVGSLVAQGGRDILPEMFCTPEGKGQSGLLPYPCEPELTTLSYLLKNGYLLQIYEPWLCTALVRDGMKADNIFVFQYDFRMSVKEISEQLDAYIGKVLAYKKAEKLNLFGLSYGGLITGTYLSRFGLKKQVDNAVLNVPALGGAELSVSFIDAKADFNVVDVIKYVNTTFGIELDAEQTVGFVDPVDFNEAGTAFLEGIRSLPLFWPSIWDLVPTEQYEILKNKYLDKQANAAIIASADYIHYKIMPAYTENFLKCMDAGVKISIMNNYGIASAFGSENISDLMVECKYGTGANCAPAGQRFDNGYVCKNTVCQTPAHNHLSPAMNIDASCAYLPENTWYVDGQGHGTYANESYTYSLVKKLLFAHEPVDIYSDPSYPQFKASHYAYYGVSAEFDKSKPGYLGAQDTALIVKNLSALSPILLTKLVCREVDIPLDFSEKFLLPGQTVRIPIQKEIPNIGTTYFAIDIDFIRLGSLTPMNSRTLHYTLNNGAAPVDSGELVPLENGGNLAVKTALSKINAVISDIYFGTQSFFNSVLKSGK